MYNKYATFDDWLFHYNSITTKRRYLRITNSNGFFEIFKPNHHHARKDGRMLEHRLVWEEAHKACLLPWANVFHVNGIKKDNRPENLKAIMWHRDYIPKRIAKDIPKILKSMGLS